MSNGFVVQTNIFEGPFDLLLTLIERRKLYISDLSLAQVTDDFISYIERSEEFPVSESADFIVIAATLLLVKSRSLLSSLELTAEEEESIEDLEHRLKLYKRMRELSHQVKAQFGLNVLFTKQPLKIREPIFSPDPKFTVPYLEEAIRNIVANLPKKIPMPQALVKKVITLEEMINRLTDRITSSLSIQFKEFSSMGKAEKIDIIVSFLAMLELVKQGVINVQQDDAFSDIVMESGNVTTPNYG